jgi:hypothetical protein
LPAGAVFKLQGQHAHADQVAAVNPFEADRDHRSHAEEYVPLAAQSRLLPVPYSAPARTISGTFSACTASRRRKSRHGGAARAEWRVTPPSVAVGQMVADADIGERAARHHAVVAAAGAVAVEVDRLHAVLHQELAGGLSCAIDCRPARYGRS